MSRLRELIRVKPAVANGLVEEGFLERVRGEDGSIGYVLTEQGVREAEQLLEHSPAARAYLARLREAS